MKFTPKYTTVRGEGGVLEFFLSSRLILLVIQEVMQNFKIVALLLLGYFWLVMKKIKIKELLIIIATLATTEVSAGALGFGLVVCPEYSCELPDASTTYAPDQTETENSYSEGSTQTNYEEETTTQTREIQFDDADDEYDEITEINDTKTDSKTESVQEGTTVLSMESQEDVTNTIEVTEPVDLLTEESSEGIDGSTQTEQEATTETESTTASFLSMGSMGSASFLSMGSMGSMGSASSLSMGSAMPNL